ncbi:MAG: substrate-binding domain-containing protein [Clostridia bacterium]|nr:substrate-binding domain-containing protein [Clostridia bacterium]
MKKKLLAAALIFVLAASMLSGCTEQKPAEEQVPQEQEQQKSTLHFTAEELPKIDGATALAPYYEAMAAKLLDMDVKDARQYVQCNRTDGAYENLISGKVDMIFCSMPSTEQKQMAEDAGVEFETFPFLNGGFVFFVNKDNPVESLSVKQLHDIYSGKIKNWKEVGGKDVEIVPFQRPDNSGSQTGIYNYVISEDEIMDAPTEMKIADMGGIIDAVASYDNAAGAIGYSYYYYVANMHYSDKIKLVAIDGILPGDDTIADGTYPLINPSLVIINKGTPKNSPVRKVVEWILSDEGKQVARENGYVPKED